MSREQFTESRKLLLSKINELKANLTEEMSNLKARQMGGRLSVIRSAAVFFRAPRSFTMSPSSRNAQFQLKQSKLTFLDALYNRVEDMEYGHSLDGRNDRNSGASEDDIRQRQEFELHTIDGYQIASAGHTSRVASLVDEVAHFATASCIYGAGAQQENGFESPAPC